MTMDDVYLPFLPLAHILDRTIEEYFFRKSASVGYYHGDLNALRDDLMELKPTLFAGIPHVFEKVYEGIKKAVEELNPVRRTVFGMLYNYFCFQIGQHRFVQIWAFIVGFNTRNQSMYY